MPRWLGSIALSASSALKRRGGERLLLAVDANACAISVMFPLTPPPASRAKRAMSNGRIAVVDDTVEHEPGDRIGRDRREQDAVAMVAGRVDQAGYGRRSENGSVVAAAGAVPDPHFVDRQFLDRGNGAPGGFEQRQQVRRPSASSSKPFSSTVAPTISRPSRRGTR